MTSRRMFDSAELKTKLIAHLTEIPSKVDRNSPDYIQVNGQLYVKQAENYFTIYNLEGKVFTFKSYLHLTNPFNVYFNIEYTEPNGRVMRGTAMDAGSDYFEYWDENTDVVSVYEDYKWIDDCYRTVKIITTDLNENNKADYEKLVMFLNENATVDPSSYSYKYVAANITKATELPVATVDSPDFVQIETTLYMKKRTARVQNLIGTEWYLHVRFDETLNGANPFMIKFRSNSQDFIGIEYEADYNMTYLWDNDDIVVYSGADAGGDRRWTNPNFRRIRISGGSDVCNQACINWLYNNAYLQDYNVDNLGYEYLSLDPWNSLKGSVEISENISGWTLPRLLNIPLETKERRLIEIDFGGNRCYFLIHNITDEGSASTTVLSGICDRWDDTINALHAYQILSLEWNDASFEVHVFDFNEQTITRYNVIDFARLLRGRDDVSYKVNWL